MTEFKTATKISIEPAMIERINKVADFTGFTQSEIIGWAIEYFLEFAFLDNAKQALIRPEYVKRIPKDKTMRIFGTPKDRQSIENLKLIIFLAFNTEFYGDLTPYFCGITQSVIFQTDRFGTPSGAVELWSLWDIPKDHPLRENVVWEEEVISSKVDRQLEEALELLKSLD